MACSDGISANIVSNCTTAITGGLEVKAWIYNRSVITAAIQAGNITFNNLMLDTFGGLVLAAGTAFTMTGVRKLLNSGSDVVVADNRPKKWAHSFMLEIFDRTAEGIANGDRLNDVVVIVENKDKGTAGDGAFEVLGLSHGLWKSSDVQSANTANGSRVIELKSLAGQEEQFSKNTLLVTDYATTLAALEATE